MGKIRKISATGGEPVKTALTVQKTVGATSITVNSIEGWHTGTSSDDEVPFVIYAVKPTGEIIAGSQSSWMGVVSRSSSTINNLRLTGGQDQIYPVGSKVVATSTAAWANELAEALLASHNPDGSLKTQEVPNSSIDGVKLKDNTIDGAKIKDGSIEPGKLAKTVYSQRKTSPTSLQTSSRREAIQASDISHTSKTGKVLIITHAMMSVSRYTGGYEIIQGGRVLEEVRTNASDRAVPLVGFIVADAPVGTPTTYSLQGWSQDSGTTWTVHGYHMTKVLVVDI